MRKTENECLSDTTYWQGRTPKTETIRQNNDHIVKDFCSMKGTVGKVDGQEIEQMMLAKPKTIRV